MTNDALFVMQKAKLDNQCDSTHEKRAIHGTTTKTIKEANKHPNDPLCIQFLQTTNDFRALNFRDMFGPSGKSSNSDKVFINVKVFFQTMLAILREEISLLETFWFHKPYNMGQNNDKFLLKEQEKMVRAKKSEVGCQTTDRGQYY